MRICTVSECEEKHKGRGLCDKHYQRFKKNGQLETIRSHERHGYGRIPEYETWCGMKKRCYNSKCRDYHLYGGRGITICERWRTAFVVFYTDMGPRPTSKHSIDRIDVNGNYEPNNCRWATRSEQARNMRTQENCSSPYRGVTWASRMNQWVVKIRHDNKLLHVGYFINEEQAAVAYDCAAIQLRGHNARLNIIGAA